MDILWQKLHFYTIHSECIDASKVLSHQRCYTVTSLQRIAQNMNKTVRFKQKRLTLFDSTVNISIERLVERSSNGFLNRQSNGRSNEHSNEQLNGQFQ